MPIQFLNTPARTDISRLRSDAKKRVKLQEIPLSTALDEVAHEAVGAQSWSEMMSDHVVTLDDNNTLSFAVTSPSNETWNVRSQLTVSLEDLRDALMSTRTLSYNAKAIGSKRRTQIEMTVGLRDMTLGHGSYTHMMSEKDAEGVRASLLNSSMRLRAGGAATAINLILHEKSSIWAEVSYDKYTAVVIAPGKGSITNTLHDGTYKSLTELAGLDRGQNLVATVIDDDRGIIAIHLNEKYVEQGGSARIDDKTIMGQVVLICRDPETGNDRDLPEDMPDLSISESVAVSRSGLKSGSGLFGMRGSPLNNPNNIWGRGPEMTADPSRYVVSPDGKCPIELSPSTDLTRVSRPTVYRAKVGEKFLEMAYEDRGWNLQVGNLEGCSVSREFNISCTDMRINRGQLMHILLASEGMKLTTGSWFSRGISVGGALSLDPITTADLTMFKARVDARKEHDAQQEKILDELPILIQGGRKGDWVRCDMPTAFLKDRGVQIENPDVPDEAPDGWFWAALVMRSTVRAAILMPSEGVPISLDDWEDNGRVYLNSGLDSTWTYAGALADIILSGIAEEHQNSGYDIVQQIVRDNDDMPEFDIRENFGLDSDGKQIDFDEDFANWMEENTRDLGNGN